jgi:hypothetical protein
LLRRGDLAMIGTVRMSGVPRPSSQGPFLRCVPGGVVGAIGVALTVSLVACGPIHYVGGVTRGASAAVDDARAARAEILAPYWWTRAIEYLTRARVEAAHADWEAANRFGRLAEEAATTAVTEAAAAAADPSRRPLLEPEAAPAKEAVESQGSAPASPAKVAPAKETTP